ncbi:kinase-like domain-containing protein [Gigaspora rosea]|uniref:Kinase-like domain-containing protein n=1 Tax=Gigaspora rosea TaxID=44941 RepID=A0A397VZE0_9GLOM|nr:kinase-like domain-containing protein [Gigaspora rosea]
MKTFLIRAWKYEEAIEWIPFDRLSEVKEIGKGGSGSVYSAFWLDGIRKVEKINYGDNYIYKRARELSSIVALKTLMCSKETKYDFLKEFKSLMACKINYSKLAIYGITQNSETKEYLIVFQYAKNGSLYKYLKTNFIKLTWQAKLEILKHISYELSSIHMLAGYIHADFHSGNILQDQQSYIADLGSSRKKMKECWKEIFMELCPILHQKFY